MYGPPIDQSIFTSVRGREMDGYQLAAVSPGVMTEEAQELKVWGPAHDSLLDPRPGAQSINFHPLASGRFAISLPTALGAEYSGRGGCQIYTQSLLVAPETLGRFANDPFRVFEAAQAGGHLEPRSDPPASLETFTLPGGAAPVNGGLITRAIHEVGITTLGRFVDAALSHPCLAVTGNAPARRLFASLLNLLPVECRTEFPFTTGLRRSTRRPFRLFSYCDHVSDRRRTAQVLPFTVIDLDAAPDTAANLHAWANFVTTILREQGLPRLIEMLQAPRPNLACRDLADLAASLASSTLTAPATVN